MPKEHCERDEDGVRRCEPEEQYNERMSNRRRSTSSSSSSSSASDARRHSHTNRGPKKNSSVLKHIVKQSRSGASSQIDPGHQRRLAVAKRVDEWLVHSDVAEPLETFSSLRFSDTNAAQKRFGRQPRTVERDTIGTHYEVNFEENDDGDTSSSSSSGDYSSSDGTSASDTSSDDDDKK